MPRSRRSIPILLAAGLAACAVVGAAAPANAMVPDYVAASSTALSTHVALGAFASGFPGSGSQVTQFESMLGRKVAIASSYQGLGDVFPDASETADAATGHTLLISWDMGETAASTFASFTSGAHDSYLAQEAAAAKAFGKVFYVRPWAEMNGDWNDFQPTATGAKTAGGTYAQFIAAWRYVVTYFRSHGATNVRWVFNPTTDTYAGTTPVSDIWPGASYVDVLGLDGYNWGTGGLFHWESFAAVYQKQYDNLVALDPNLPVWVCEFGSKEPTESDGAPVDPAHSKATWYRGMLATTTFPHISALVFFDIDKERDWRVNSDSASLKAITSLAKTALTTVPNGLPGS